MKRAAIIVVLIAIVACALAADTSAFYPVRVDVVKVYSHADGFLVVYRKGTSDVADVYCPPAGSSPGARPSSSAARTRAFPYMTVFYKNGKFDHLRLYVISPTRTDSTWGVLSPSEGAGKFNSEDLKHRVLSPFSD